MSADESSEGRPIYDRPFVAPPESIVSDGAFSYGCFNGPIPRTNILDVDMPYHYQVPCWFKKSRCKQWRAFQLGDSRYFVFTAMYEAGIFGLALFYIWDRERKRAHEYRRLVPLRSFGIGEKLNGEQLEFGDRHGHIMYRTDLSKGEVLIEASVSRRGRRPAFSAGFRLAYNGRQTSACSSCLPLGLNRAMYSAKVLMPMEGWVLADDERYEMIGADAMGIMDDHKGFYPYRMHSDWVTGFGIDGKGRRVGFNLTDNQVRDQSVYNENILWINSRAFPLPPVKVTRPHGPAAEWHIQDTEGLVDLLFRPERKNDIKLNALVFAVNYHGPFGSFEGTLRSPDGSERIAVRSLYGMGEKKYLRV
ncbi:MAG: DUF2804 domain-containing protein [Spirochaetales bacterium]|nr:MAG: DUF2804 domain-containing protein [Spirochaetales bacterium]